MYSQPQRTVAAANKPHLFHSCGYFLGPVRKVLFLCTLMVTFFFGGGESQAQMQRENKTTAPDKFKIQKFDNGIGYNGTLYKGDIEPIDPDDLVKNTYKNTYNAANAAPPSLYGKKLSAQERYREALKERQEKLERGEAVPYVSPLMEMDENQDDVVTYAEAMAKQNAGFDLMDNNKDGFLTVREVEGYFGNIVRSSGGGAAKNITEDLVFALGTLDKNADGKIARNEFKSSEVEAFTAADSNKDGLVTLQEMQQSARAMSAGTSSRSSLPPDRLLGVTNPAVAQKTPSNPVKIISPSAGQVGRYQQMLDIIRQKGMSSKELQLGVMKSAGASQPGGGLEGPFDREPEESLVGLGNFNPYRGLVPFAKNHKPVPPMKSLQIGPTTMPTLTQPLQSSQGTQPSSSVRPGGNYSSGKPAPGTAAPSRDSNNHTDAEPAVKRGVLTRPSPIFIP